MEGGGGSEYWGLRRDREDVVMDRPYIERERERRGRDVAWDEGGGRGCGR